MQRSAWLARAKCLGTVLIFAFAQAWNRSVLWNSWLQANRALLQAIRAVALFSSFFLVFRLFFPPSRRAALIMPRLTTWSLSRWSRSSQSTRPTPNNDKPPSRPEPSPSPLSSQPLRLSGSPRRSAASKASWLRGDQQHRKPSPPPRCYWRTFVSSNVRAHSPGRIRGSSQVPAKGSPTQQRLLSMRPTMASPARQTRPARLLHDFKLSCLYEECMCDMAPCPFTSPRSWCTHLPHSRHTVNKWAKHTMIRYWTYRAELTNDPSFRVNQKMNDSEVACCGAEVLGYHATWYESLCDRQTVASTSSSEFCLN